MEKQHPEEMDKLELLDEEITAAKLENERLKRDCSESIKKERLLRENLKKLKESKQLVASIVSDLQKQIVLENINIDNKKREHDQILNRYYEMIGVCEHGVIILLKMNMFVIKSLEEKATEFKVSVDQYLLSVKIEKEMVTMKLNEEVNRLNRVLKQVNAAQLELVQLKKYEIASLEEEKQKILTMNRQIKASCDVSTITSLEVDSYDSNCNSFSCQNIENQRDIQYKIMKKNYFSKIPVLKDYVKRKENVIKQCKLQKPSKLIISSGIKSGESNIPLRVAYNSSPFNIDCEKKLKLLEKSHRKDLNELHCIRKELNEVNNIYLQKNNMFIKNSAIESFEKNVIDITPISNSCKSKCICNSENNNEITIDEDVKMNSNSEVNKLTPEKEKLIEKQQCSSNKSMEKDLSFNMDRVNNVHNENNLVKTSLSGLNLNDRIPELIELENLSGIGSSEVSIMSLHKPKNKLDTEDESKLSISETSFKQKYGDNDLRYLNEFCDKLEKIFFTNSSTNDSERYFKTTNTFYHFPVSKHVHKRNKKITSIEYKTRKNGSRVRGISLSGSFRHYSKSLMCVGKSRDKNISDGMIYEGNLHMNCDDSKKLHEDVHTGCGDIVSGDIVSCQPLQCVETISECFLDICTKVYTAGGDFLPAIEGSWKKINNEFMSFDCKLADDSRSNEPCQSELFTVSFNDNDNSLVPYMFKLK